LQSKFISHCAVLNSYQDVAVGKKKKKRKKENIKTVLSNTVLKALPFYFTAAR